LSQKATKPGVPEPADPTAKQVAAYLRDHPDFLQQYPDLLAIIETPVRGAGQSEMR